MSETTTIKTFITGKTYACSSICDSECIWKFEILKRTAKTITIYDTMSKEIVRRKIFIYDDQECIKPFGSYSMSATLRAEKECEA